MSLLPLGINAQEATPPPEVPTEVPTDIPPATATAALTETPTLTPTPTSTEAATHTPTATPIVIEATGEVTVETTILPATATPLSPVITETASPITWSRLYEDTFLVPPFANWSLPDDWSMFFFEDSWVLVNGKSSSPLVFTAPLSNVAVQAEFLIHNASAQITVRGSAADGYTAALHQSGQLDLMRGGSVVQSTTVMNFQPGLWHTLVIFAVNGQISILVNDVLLLNYTDPAPLLTSGAIELHGSPDGQSAFFLDNVQVLVPSTELSSAPVLLASAAQMPSLSNSASMAQTMSGSGTHIAYSYAGDIYVVDPANLNVTHNLTNSPEAGEVAPDLSRDGRKLLFTVNASLYVMDANNNHLVTLIGTGGTAYLPRWNPSATRIAFMSERDGNTEIYIREADGTVRRITNDSGYSGFPSWSADGSTLTYIVFQAATIDLYRISTTDPNPVPTLIVAYPNSTALMKPAFSPVVGSSRIAFYSDQASGSNQADVYTINADGSDQCRLTTDDEAFASGPIWSPNGQQIVYKDTAGLKLLTNIVCGSVSAQLLQAGGNITPNSWSLAFPLPGSPAPTPTPTPTRTPTPTPTPTATPTPIPTPWEVNIEPNATIPSLVAQYAPCPRTGPDAGDPAFADVCAADTLRLRQPLTWENLIALIIEGEGRSIMSIVPSQPALGTCWYNLQRGNGENWVTGSQYCNGYNSDGLQRDFVRAVVQQLHNLCWRQPANPASQLGEKRCNEANLIDFLDGLSAWYSNSNMSSNQYPYADEARDMLNNFPSLYAYNVCPCKWGNYADGVTEEQIRLADNPNPSANRTHTYSYIRFDPLEGIYRWFAIE